MMNKYEELAKKYDGVKTKKLPNGIQFKNNKTSVTIYPSTGTIVSDVCGKINVLKKAGIGKLDHEMNKHFSVITPKQKEYLVKTDTGYTLQVLSDVVDGHDGIIEVPEGAEVAVHYPANGNTYFWKNNGEEIYSNSEWKSCSSSLTRNFATLKMFMDAYTDIGARIVWQRESLNDQVASAEEYRKIFTHTPKVTLDIMNNIQNAFEKAQGAINSQNAMAKLFAYQQYISGVAHGKEFIVKPNNKKKDESDLVNDGQSIMDGLVDDLKSNGFSEGGFIPKRNHGAPVGVVTHGFSGFTQPEELPFVDDEPKLRNIKIRVNGNFDKAIETIQSMGYWNCQFNRIPSDCYWLVGNSDATVDYGSEQHMYIDHHVEYFVDGAIDKTQETLNERQSTYGDFKDVAGMTQELLAVMEQYGYSDMPKPHKEALHMICSKMARIVNGDHNHLDSWHDIGGYAKLIENNIK